MILKGKKFSAILLILIVTLTITCIPIEFAHATIKKVAPATETDNFTSSDTTGDEYCQGYTSGTTLRVKLRTKLPSVEFRIALYGVNPKTEMVDLGVYVNAEFFGISSTGKNITGFDYTVDFSDKEIPDGEYFLYISRMKTAGGSYEKSPSNGALYKNMPVKFKDGRPTLMRFDDIIKENDTIQKKTGFDPSEYLDTTLEDIRFLLVIPGTSLREPMTQDKVNFMQYISNRVTAGASSDYDKMIQLYEYTAENFYYDSVAFSTHSNQYANPYNNVYNFENKIASKNSDYYGRVATTCQGFAGIYLALARAQGIPTRLVFGHRAAPPKFNWYTEGNLETRDHWWAESYVNGRWVFVDPTAGTNNRWYSTSNQWQRYGLTNYTYFDPSKEQIGATHLFFKVYRNTFAGKECKDKTEISRLTTFLEKTSNGIKNGKIMNPVYSANSKKTWGDGITDNFYGNGEGYTSKIIWDNFGFTGSANFSEFKKLKTISLKDNKLSTINLSGNTLLRHVYLQNNKLTSINLTNCKNLIDVDTSGNALKKISIYANKRNTTISAEDNGTIGISYNKENRYKLRASFNPEIGYKVEGLYNKAGRRIARTKTYSMNPVSSAYRVKFVLNPNSYKYTLNAGSNYGEYKDYNLAAQKRLKTLGYYISVQDGIFGSDMEASVRLFQTDYNLPVTGEIDQHTWSILFNPNPKPVVIEPEPEDPVTPADSNTTDQPILKEDKAIAEDSSLEDTTIIE